jgi:hypothetical protein
VKIQRLVRQLGALAGAACALACTSAARGFCQAAAVCDAEDTPEDRVGESEDSVDVCTKSTEGQLATLRANEEPACKEAADRIEVYYRCVESKAAEGEECAGLRTENDNECVTELKAAREALVDAGDDCEGA